MEGRARRGLHREAADGLTKTVQELLFETHLRARAAALLTHRSGECAGKCWAAVKRWDASMLMKMIRRWEAEPPAMENR